MFQRENDIQSYTCPDCGVALLEDGELLHCETHGAFFVYGPQLLVRAPEGATKRRAAVLPWETSADASSESR